MNTDKTYPFEIQLAKYVLGYLNESFLPTLAQHALLEGYYSYSLLYFLDDVSGEEMISKIKDKMLIELKDWVKKIKILKVSN